MPSTRRPRLSVHFRTLIRQLALGSNTFGFPPLMTLVPRLWHHRAATAPTLIFFHTRRRPRHISWALRQRILEEPNA